MGAYYIGTMPFGASSELQHHGVKGQKWGIRRFQNADGTLTAEGRARYSLDSPNRRGARLLQKDIRRDNGTLRSVSLRPKPQSDQEFFRELARQNKLFDELKRSGYKVVFRASRNPLYIDPDWKHYVTVGKRYQK